MKSDEKPLRTPSPTEIVVKEEVIRLLRDGWSLTKIARLPNFPARHVISGWVVDDDAGDDFASRYTRARKEGWEVWADEIKDISDEQNLGEITVEKVGTDPRGNPTRTTETKTVDMIEHRRLQVDTRKWVLAKMLPKIYGDKVTQEITGPDGGPVVAATRVQVQAVTAAEAAAEYQKMLGGK